MTRRTRSDFERFYAESKNQCFRAVLATVGVADEADDLVAEAYTRALRKVEDGHRSSGPESLGGTHRPQPWGRR